MAALLAVASLASGCALGTGDLGRPRQTVLDSYFSHLDTATTPVERELDNRLWHFRQAPGALNGLGASAHFSALADAVEVDRALLPSLVEVLSAASDKQRIRDGMAKVAPPVSPDAGERLGERAARQSEAKLQICSLLMYRGSVYRSALEEAVARAPELEAVRVERSLLKLEADIAGHCGSHQLNAPNSPLHR